MLPGVEGLLIGKSEDDLKLIVARRRRQYAGAQVAGKVRGQLFALV